VGTLASFCQRAVVKHAGAQDGQVAAAADLPAGQVRYSKVRLHVGVGKHDVVAPADTSAAAPSRVGLDVVAQRVLAVARLSDRVDPNGPLPTVNEPRPAIDPNVAALDLNDHHAGVGHQHH